MQNSRQTQAGVLQTQSYKRILLLYRQMSMCQDENTSYERI